MEAEEGEMTTTTEDLEDFIDVLTSMIGHHHAHHREHHHRRRREDVATEEVAETVAEAAMTIIMIGIIRGNGRGQA